MTYSATILSSATVLSAIGSGLVTHDPVYEIKEARRVILLPPDLRPTLRGEDTEFPGKAAAGDLIAPFLLGHALKVSQKNRRGILFRKPEQPLFERLEGHEEIWVLCFRKPGAGWRVSGRFLEKDVFAVFDIRPKENVGKGYADVAAHVTEEWAKYFGNQPPHTGNWIDGYLSGSHYDVDEKGQIGE